MISKEFEIVQWTVANIRHISIVGGEAITKPHVVLHHVKYAMPKKGKKKWLSKMVNFL